ncbi:hypothetical protein JG687_00018685 [Phytophthora cactorum]|uniref:Uncharacterized protein n=1 Tax=Phytophthora cactorum TaxID=29920 RepID=A0A8T1TL40_9STRA|nr:hypothetical protein JG687_00018685 [Phytophthora cactorum]
MVKVKQEDDAKGMKIEEQKLALAAKKEDRESKLSEVNLIIMKTKAREAAIHEKTQLLIARKQLQDAGVKQKKSRSLPLVFLCRPKETALSVVACHHLK